MQRIRIPLGPENGILTTSDGNLGVRRLGLQPVGNRFASELAGHRMGSFQGSSGSAMYLICGDYC